MSEQSRHKRIRINVVTNIILKVAMALYAFIVARIIIGKYGSETNGLISSVTNFLAYITLFESGFGPVVKSVLYKPIAKKDNKTIEKIMGVSEVFFRKISFIFVIYVIGLSVVYSLVVGKNVDLASTSILVVILAINTFFEYFVGMTYGLFLQAEQKNYVISIIKTIIYIVNLILVLILVKCDASIYVLELVTGMVFALKSIAQKIYVDKKYDIRPTFDKEYKIKQKWDGLVQHIASVIHTNTDVVILTFFSTLNEVSVYAVYFLAVKGVKMLVESFTIGVDESFGDMIAKEEDIKDSFGKYERMYFSICTICFATLMIMITPFVSVYTKSVTDANYIQWAFGYLIVISEFIWAIRQPYNSLVKSAGQFKETQKGALAECILNMLISLALVFQFGLVGVAIGTVVAMAVRMVELVYHSNKYIIKRNVFESYKKFALVAIETGLIVAITKLLPFFENTSYFNLVLNGLMVLIVSTIVVVFINYFCMRSGKEQNDKRASVRNH